MSKATKIGVIVTLVVGLVMGAALARASLADDRPTQTNPDRGVSQSKGVGIDPTTFDPSIGVCENFYRHVCGGFIAEARPSAAMPVVDRTAQAFDASLDRNLERLFAEDASGDPELQRLETFYASCQTLDAGGTVTIMAWLARIDTVRTPDQIQTLMRDLSVIGVDPFFTYGGRPDRTDWTRYRGEIHNSRIWADASAVERAFVLAGLPQSVARRDAGVVAEMAETLRAQTGSRWDNQKGENPRTLTELEGLAPHIDWRRYFALVGAPADRPVNVTSPAYLSTVDRELAERSPEDLRAWLRWSFLLSLRGELPAPYNAVFGDVPPNLRVAVGEPERRCREATVRAMGVEFSRQYATRILGMEAREAAQIMAETIKTGIVASIADDDWLSPQARRATADKLSKTDLKIGFPDNWPEVGRYPLSRDRFIDNVLAARTFEQQREWGRAGQPRSRGDWDMKVDPWVGEGMAAARLVLPNGYPDAFTNSLIMSAAFLAPPRFDPEAAPELNYATFGAVFAHEFVHVAQTHMFGPDGRATALWSDSDIQAAEVRGQCVIDQANAYEALPGLRTPGDRQFGENVADYGGLRLAYEALAASLGRRMGQRDATGTTPAQRFFYKFAQSQCTAQTDASLRQSVATDGHAPAEFRVNAPLSNLPAFAEAFGCEPGAKMTRPALEQCRVW